MLPTIAVITQSIGESVYQDMEKDALGTQDYIVKNEHESNPPESEEASIEEEDFSNDDSNFPLGEWMNLPRRSRDISGLEPSINFEDEKPLEKTWNRRFGSELTSRVITCKINQH